MNLSKNDVADYIFGNKKLFNTVESFRIDEAWAEFEKKCKYKEDADLHHNTLKGGYIREDNLAKKNNNLKDYKRIYNEN